MTGATNDANLHEFYILALALVIGTEAMVVFKDVLQMSDKDATKVKRWAIRALVEAALASSGKPA